MEEDEELLLLRIKALKSSARVKIQVDIHSDSENEQKVKQTDVSFSRGEQNKTVIINTSDLDNAVQLSEATNNEVALRQMALNSIAPSKKCATPRKSQKDEKNLEPKPSDTSFVEIQSNLMSTPQSTNQPKKSTAESKNIEELSLREKALKTLLEKRVAKTEKLIKHVVQHEKVSSTSAKMHEKNQHKSDDVNKELVNGAGKSRKKRQLRNSFPTPVLRNFLPPEGMSVSIESADNQDELQQIEEGLERLDSVHIGSDDELSLCASDRDEADLENSPFKEPETKQDSIRPVKEPNECNVSDIQCNVISSCFEKVGKAAFDEANQTDEAKTDVTIDRDIKECHSMVQTEKLENSMDEKKERSLEENQPPHEEMPIDCLPGPSGYKGSLPPKNNSSDSDSSSVMEIIPPAQTKPRVVSLLSNSSGSDGETTKDKRKGKQKKRKKTVKECLMKQDGINDNREDLKDLSCSICLGPFDNRSFLKECFHSFCHLCIIQWAELSRLCPLCKKYYTALIHTVTKDLDYTEYVFPMEAKQPETSRSLSAGRRQFSETMEDGRRFRYQSTMVDHERWQARREERERIEQQHTQARSQRKLNRRLKWSATKDRRKAVYRMKMYVKQVKQHGKPLCRDISPKFFADNPAIKHRLVPWLLRDLNVLLGEDDEHIRFVMSLILNLIAKIPMNSEEFREQLRGFLYDKTDQFVSELISFASSPYDIRGYDSNVVYDVQPTVINVENENEPFEDRLLHEVFISDGNEEQIMSHVTDNDKDQIENETEEKSNSSGSKSNSGNEPTSDNEDEEQHFHVAPKQNIILKKSILSLVTSTSPSQTTATSERTTTTTSAIEATTAATVMTEHDVLKTTDSIHETENSQTNKRSEENEYKKRRHSRNKRKKKKKKKERNSQTNSDYDDIEDRKKDESCNSEDVIEKEISESNLNRSNKNEDDELEENSTKSEKKRKKKHRHRKHKQRKKYDSQIEDDEEDDEGEDRDGREKVHDEDSPQHGDSSTRPKDTKHLKQERREQNKNKKDFVGVSDGDSYEVRRHRKHKRHKKLKKKHHKTHKKYDADGADRYDDKRKNDNYVTDRLQSLLGVSTDKRSTHDPSNGNIKELNKNLETYVKEAGIHNNGHLIEDSGTLKTQTEIIFELLAVEKAILRQHKKKELKALKRRGEKLEELRAKKKKVGAEDYKQFDEELDDVTRKISKCKKHIEKLKSNDK